jgi:hypothetical protein
VFLICSPLFSQSSQGTIQGSVFDQSGGAIAGATVTVTDVARGLVRTLTTDSAGEYVAQNLNPGAYTVKAEAKGFQALEHSGVQVEVRQNIRVDLTLQPGAQTQTITVTSEAPAIDTSDSTLGGTVSNASMLALPLNGRNFQRLIDLHPGVVIATVGAGTGNGDYTNGRKQGDDLYRVEGISTIAQTAGLSGVLNGAYRAGDSSSLVPIDAIQEFSTEQSPKADSGWKEGSVVSVGIKSGTNSLHGTAYAFGRDAGATDAANAFSKTITQGTLEQFGATAGGRIIKDKLFLFGGYEGLRDTLGDSNTDTIPYDVATPGTANPAASIVDACNNIETLGGTKSANPALISPLSAQLAGLNTATCTVSPASSAFENVFPYIGFVPTTTSSSGAPVENYNPPLTSTGPLNNGIIKGDYVPGPHNHFSGMYFVAKATQSINTFGGQLEQQWLNGVVDDVQMYMGSWTWTPNSTWVNDVRFGKAYFNNSTIVGDANLSAAGAWPAGYGMNTGVTNPLFGGIPQITFTAFTGYLGVGTDGLSTRGPEGNYNLVDNVSFLHGKHSFKFGFEYSDILFDQKNAGNILDNQSGLIKFAGLGSSSAAGVLTGGFLTGATTGGNLLIGDNTTNYGSHWFAGFFQDDWRVATRVTLNLGLRYEYMGSPFERNNYMGNFNPNVNPATTSAIEQVGPGEPIPSLYNSKYNAFPNNLSPRLGVAWDVQGNGKTVVRAGVSILSDFTGLQTLIKSTPFGANIIGCTVTTLPCPAADYSLIANTAPGGVPTPQNAHTAVFNSYTAAQLTAGWASNSVAAPIFPGTTTVTIGGVSTPFTGVTCTPAVPCSAGTVVDPNFRQPHAAEYNLDIERAITNNLAIDVAYVGNKGFDEPFTTDLDQALPGIGWTGNNGAAITTCLSPASVAAGYNNCKANAAAEVGLYTNVFQYLNQISQAQAGAISNYNALQVTATLRATHGLSFLLGYTWAHALDDGTIVFPNQLSQNYGNGTADIRNRFTISPTYEVPGIKSPGQMLEGWSVSGLVLLQGGLPWTATDSSSGAANDILGSAGATGTPSYDTWNYSGPPSAFTTSQTPIPCYDGISGKMSGCASFAQTPASIQAACANAAVAPYGGPTTTNGMLAIASLANFGCYVQNGGIMTPPAYGTYGDSSNGEFRGPHFYNVDLSVSKTWKFKERYSAQFRAEFFNLLNTADFVQTPTSTIPGAAQFGCSCTTPDNPARNPNPITGSGGPRHIQFGLKLAF